MLTNILLVAEIAFMTVDISREESGKRRGRIFIIGFVTGAVLLGRLM